MAVVEPCTGCANDFPITVAECPHCGRLCRFPNVRVAEQPEESAALDQRYSKAKDNAYAEGLEKILTEFEAELAHSQAVIARPIGELERLVESDNEVYATFGQLVSGGVKIPTGEKWDALRRTAEAAMFPFYEKNVRFAALSLGEIGLKNYGECWLFLKNDLIAHRASVLEENCVLFMQHQGTTFAQAHDLPKGYRAPWKERSKLCVAKLAMKLDSAMSAASFPKLLIHQGATTADDDFVEVHIWGSITRRTLNEVIITIQPRRRSLKQRLKNIQTRLTQVGVPVKALETV